MRRADVATGGPADDQTLLEQGRHAELLARHYDDLRTRVAIHLYRRHHADHLDDVVHRAVERLARELRAGTRYGVPYAAVVATVARMAVLDWAAERRREEERHGGDPGAVAGDAAGDPYGEVEARDLLETAVRHLPDGQRTVALLRWRDGLPIDEIARRTGRTRNAVDQALHRVRAVLREVMLP